MSDRSLRRRIDRIGGVMMTMQRGKRWQGCSVVKRLDEKRAGGKKIDLEAQLLTMSRPGVGLG
jgi:hypothetical protein